MGIRNKPHFRITTGELATWLENQGPDRWWTVDGDPFLAERVELPAPADELAAAFRQLNRTLLLADHSQERAAIGEQIDHTRLEQLTKDFGTGGAANVGQPSWQRDGELALCWEDDADDDGWLLYEDEETSEMYRREAISSQQHRE